MTKFKTVGVALAAMMLAARATPTVLNLVIR